MDCAVTGSLARELPAVVADTAKAEGVAHRPQHLPTLRTPIGQTYDASRRRCSLRGALPPPGAPECAEGGASPRPQNNYLLHGSFNTWLPRGRDCVGGVLPAVVADTAKAEGVAQRPQHLPTLRTPRGQTYDASRRTCSLRGALPPLGAPECAQRAERGFPSATK